MVARVIMLCNAMTDSVRIERCISTDSPAATRKIVMMMQALRKAGVRPTLISLGRGRQDGSGRNHSAHAGRIAGIPIAYGRFVNRPLISQLCSLLAPFPILWARRHYGRSTTLVLYNRMFSHIPALWFAWALGYRTILDLEDGETSENGRLSWRSRLLVVSIDPFCRDGALLAASSLVNATRLRPAEPYYGIVTPQGLFRDFTVPQLHALIGGTVARSTGADILLLALELLFVSHPELAAQLHIHVSGSGDMVDAFRETAALITDPKITVHGRLPDQEYKVLLNQCCIGFALKPNGGELASTTFPSKVIEFAGAGVLVITTDISDVRAVLGEGAIYLTKDDPQLLANCIEVVLRNREYAARQARLGLAMAAEKCGWEQASSFLKMFITRGQV